MRYSLVCAALYARGPAVVTAFALPLAVVSAGLIAPRSARAADRVTDRAVDLVQRVHDQATQDEETASMAMRLIDAEGKVRARKASYAQRRTEPGAATSARLIRFSAPPEMDGSGILTIERNGPADDQWLYLPAYHSSRKIPSSNRTDRYMGTDFSYEDVSADRIAAYRYVFAASVVIDGRRYSQVEQTPIAEQPAAGYGRKVLFIDPERLLVRKVDLYGRTGLLIKRLEGSDPARFGAVWRWARMTMTDFRIEHSTVIDYTDRHIGSGAAASLFTVRNLERGR